jgi:hypothetical protein
VCGEFEQICHIVHISIEHGRGDEQGCQVGELGASLGLSGGNDGNVMESTRDLRQDVSDGV